VNGVFGPQRRDTFSRCQQEEIVISQDGTDGRTQILDEPDGVQGGRTSIDKISDEPQPVCLWSEGDPVEKLLQGGKAALNVADCVRGHQ
jgi:hypothetical protein